MLGSSGQKERGMADERNEAPKQKQTQNRFLRKLEGREVLVVFLDGKAVQGVLTGSDIYNLFLQREDGLEVAVFKHAIKYLHAVPGKGGARAPSAGKKG
jgi:sRNA-binding regulator protein Hfq